MKDKTKEEIQEAQFHASDTIYQEFCRAVDEKTMAPHCRGSNLWLSTANFDYAWHAAPEQIASVLEHTAKLFADAGLKGTTLNDFRVLEDVLMERRLKYFAPPNSFGVRVPVGFGDRSSVWDSYANCADEFKKLSRDLQYLSFAWEYKFPYRPSVDKPRSGFDKKERTDAIHN